MLIPKTPIIRSEKHRRFIACLPCVVSLSNEVQAAHVRKGNLCGIGMKPSDEFCLPLSVSEHAKQHRIGEESYWKPYGGHEKASALAKKLYEATGDGKEAMRLIMEFRNAFHSM